MKKIYIPIFILAICNISFGQIKSFVVDVDTKEKIPFVNIWVENENIGTISNEDGFFVLKNIDETKIVVFSATGYIIKKIEFKLIRGIVELSPQIIELNEVIITNSKKRKKEKIVDKLKRSKIKHYLPGVAKPWMFAKYFEFKEEYVKTPYLKSIRIATETENTDSKFIIRLYKINKKGEPEGYIFNENIIGTAKKGKKMTELEISDLNIEFPNTGFFVAIEWLLTKSNSYSWDSFLPNIGFIQLESNKNSWFYRFGKWKMEKCKIV